METITIERAEYGYTVRQGDRYADGLTFEGMLGLIVHLTEPDRLPYDAWMRTYVEHSEWHKYLYHLNPNSRKEQLLLEQTINE